MGKREKDYIPALGYQWLTKLYDPIVRWTMRESAFKRELVKQVNAEKGFNRFFFNQADCHHCRC
ncbi:hypothetical protein APC61_19605 [Acinetobacter baumannii]|jgi:hypothetical protein|uniref:hypothetical protein n=1 Tax=Brevibacillus TaxID=55080 RepID=UPI0007111658|nr:MULTISPECIES: hypothetical protein [Brevibacillus]KRI69652.1 hypothetical protein APC61_19605 [Acinetobacter baumannii]MBN6189197.1 hypothetical protein [Aneurinibacillus sp. BA2021]MCC0566633.1 hypothetical protein [Brevibacillus borstelensis]MCM3561393.1 hypothetical protein [Brevibacillus borstelensis]MCM3593011.1 hypothetical protein [Brevibacillus borstelensis]